ncbi:MAG TPA: DUF4412 domain-containing protein [Vicinamibacterales bacterium]
MPKLLVAALLLQAQPSPAPAPSLKTTIRMSVVLVDSALPMTADGKRSPYGNFGPLIKQLLMPDGPVTIDYMIAGEDSRAEVRGRLATLPQGSVVLQRAGEDVIRVLNPSNKTWYEIPAGRNLGTLLGVPDVTIEPTGEQATIAGQRAERFHFKETLHIPVPEGSSMPPDFPADLDLSGDLWSTDAFSGQAYSAVFRTMQSFAAIPGIEALTSGGRFPLRIALRSSVMPGYEIRSEVTAIGAASPDAKSFSVPADYQKVQSPVGGGER